MLLIDNVYKFFIQRLLRTSLSFKYFVRDILINEVPLCSPLQLFALSKRRRTALCRAHPDDTSSCISTEIHAHIHASTHPRNCEHAERRNARSANWYIYVGSSSDWRLAIPPGRSARDDVGERRQRTSTTTVNYVMRGTPFLDVPPRRRALMSVRRAWAHWTDMEIPSSFVLQQLPDTIARCGVRAIVMGAGP